MEGNFIYYSPTIALWIVQVACVGPAHLRTLLERDADDESSDAMATYEYSVGPISSTPSQPGGLF
jgi:hypothetical protein